MDNFMQNSYSQEGEDILLKRIFEYRKIEDGGFYIDIGAHHPQRFSNTYFYYKKNWNGINVDATPRSMEAFQKLRENDINLEYAVSNKREALTYYMFNEPALNSFDKKLSEKRSNIPIYSIIEEKDITTVTLEYILDTYLPKSQKIDFLSIDVEGYDYKVLISNNWKKYRPKVVLIEILSQDILSMLKTETYKFLINNDYIYFAKTVGTHFFIEKSFYNERFNK